jgi:hypothetical protein
MCPGNEKCPAMCPDHDPLRNNGFLLLWADKGTSFLFSPKHEKGGNK